MLVPVPPRRARAACGSCASAACAPATGTRRCHQSARFASQVVVAIGAGPPRMHLSRLKERPAKRRRSLPRQLPRRAAGIVLVHGDIHAGVADRLPRGGEPAGVARARRGSWPRSTDRFRSGPSAPGSRASAARRHEAHGRAARSCASVASTIASPTTICSRAGAGRSSAKSRARPGPRCR